MRFKDEIQGELLNVEIKLKTSHVEFKKEINEIESKFKKLIADLKSDFKKANSKSHQKEGNSEAGS